MASNVLKACIILISCVHSSPSTTLMTNSSDINSIDSDETESLSMGSGDQLAGPLCVGGLLILACLIICICTIRIKIKRKKFEKKELMEYNERMYGPNDDSLQNIINDITPDSINIDVSSTKYVNVPTQRKGSDSADNEQKEDIEAERAEFIPFEWNNMNKNEYKTDIKQIISEQNMKCIDNSKSGIIIKNGVYNIHQFSMSNNQYPTYKSVHVDWIKRGIMDQSDNGYILCDDKWNGLVPIVYANRSNAAFYECILDPLPSDNIELTTQCTNGGIFEFDYSVQTETNKHQQSGATLERHKYGHIETALCGEDESGLIIIGKEMENNQLYLTAFIIARGQTLYVPPNTIHTKDFQCGSWRSYTQIDKNNIIATLVKKSNNKKCIFFKFYDAVTKKRCGKYEMYPNGGNSITKTTTINSTENDDIYNLKKYLSTEL